MNFDLKLDQQIRITAQNGMEKENKREEKKKKKPLKDRKRRIKRIQRREGILTWDRLANNQRVPKDPISFYHPTNPIGIYYSPTPFCFVKPSLKPDFLARNS